MIKNIYGFIFTNIVFIFLWKIFFASISIYSIIISFMIVIFVNIYMPESVIKKWPFNMKLIPYIIWLVKEMIISSINMMKIILTNQKEPINVERKFEIKHANFKIILPIYANSITITPGTASVHIEKNILIVNALNKNVLEDLISSNMQQKIEEMVK